MNHLDDKQLIDQLHAGLADRTADIHAPDGLVDGARRAARRRTAPWSGSPSASVGVYATLPG